MQPDQPGYGTGQDEHVQRVEAGERVPADLLARSEELREPRPEERRRPVQVDPDDARPVGRLVPREEVAGESLGHPARQQQDADDPVQLARVLVRAEQEHAAHVQEHEDDEDARAPLVHAADEPPERQVVGDVDDRRVGLLRRRLVVHGEDDAGRRLDEEGGERRRAERLHPVRVRRDVAEEEVLDPADEAGALLEPVERIRDGHLEVPAAELRFGRRLARCHQWCGG